MPLSNEYFNSNKDFISIKAPGYRSSSLEISTIGVSGLISLDIDESEDYA
jgi:hypothetical protein